MVASAHAFSCVALYYLLLPADGDQVLGRGRWAHGGADFASRTSRAARNTADSRRRVALFPSLATRIASNALTPPPRAAARLRTAITSASGQRRRNAPPPYNITASTRSGALRWRPTLAILHDDVLTTASAKASAHNELYALSRETSIAATPGRSLGRHYRGKQPRSYDAGCALFCRRRGCALRRWRDSASARRHFWCAHAAAVNASFCLNTGMGRWGWCAWRWTTPAAAPLPHTCGSGAYNSGLTGLTVLPFLPRLLPTSRRIPPSSTAAWRAAPPTLLQHERG